MDNQDNRAAAQPNSGTQSRPSTPTNGYQGTRPASTGGYQGSRPQQSGGYQGGYQGNRGPSRFTPRRGPRSNIPLNENIRARSLRVIDQHGENLGELSKDEALALAREAELDLFVVADTS